MQSRIVACKIHFSMFDFSLQLIIKFLDAVGP